MYLLYDGDVGGGGTGIGRASFLAWSGAKLVPVEDSKGEVRHGNLITPIQGKDIDLVL